ncbi:MAG: hypothetical protein LIQ31_06995 [Planctomycetes bacterium]|nr:hypothetical protein [Planctomycetota bacterium]
MSVNTIASTSAAVTGLSTSTTSTSDRNDLDFMTLLIAQLTNQDPLSPMEDTDFTSQLAQLEALELQMSMNETLTLMRTDSQLQAATAMIGKDVVGTDDTGELITGTVAAVLQTGDGIQLQLPDGTLIDADSVTAVTSAESSVAAELAASTNAVGMWIEAGYDSAYQPIRGIVEKVGVVDGKVTLQLYGGESVTWDQVTSMRAPTSDESWYTFPDDVREKVEAAQGMLGQTVSGLSTEGDHVTGIVANAELSGTDVYLILFDGTYVNVESLSGEPKTPDAEDALRDLVGLTAAGLDEKGNEIAGVIVGAEDREDGMALILEDGSSLYYDAVLELTLPEEA